MVMIWTTRGLLSVVLGLILTGALVGCSSSGEETAKDTSEKVAAAKREANPYFNFQSPYSNGDQQNTRHARSSLEAANVTDLKQAWSRRLEGSGEGDGLIGFPVVSDDIVYLQDLNSNVAALDLDNGETLWEKRYDVSSLRPNGVSVSRGFQMVYGAIPTTAFALDEETGNEVWSVELTRAGSGTKVGAPPAYYNGIVYVTTRPDGEERDAGGTLWALDCRDGTKVWHVPLGGGVSGPPAFDRKGSLYIGAGSSIVRIDEATGRVDWSYRVTSRGSFDLNVGAPVVKDLHGRKLVLAGSRSGVVVALDRRTGNPIWRRSVGIHDGGVFGPISVQRSTLFVPVTAGGEGELVAIDLANGEVRWKQDFDIPLTGPTTTTNDLVVAGSRDGGVAAFEADSGKEVWRDEISGRLEGGVAIGGDTLLIQLGDPGGAPELLAYRLAG